MHNLRHSAIAVFAALLVPLADAQPIAPDLNRAADPAVWRLQNRAASTVPGEKNTLQLDARKDDGVAWLAGSNFTDGTIELRLRGANKPGQSFVGVAFRGADDERYDAIYFRPFNFKQPDALRRGRAVQYISLPEFHWEKLRRESPGKFEAAISPTPDPDDWFHARIVVEDRKVSVYVNGATTPCLVVNELSDRRDGLVGLWVGNGSAGNFADFRITPMKR